MSMQALNHDAPEHSAHDAFLEDVLSGLSARGKSLPAKYFYDEEGSRLFDAITRLEEYYPTRIETALLCEHAAEVARIAGPRAAVIEFGAGSLAKARILLAALARPKMYAPIDLSADYLTEAAASLRRDFPRLAVQPIIADFTRPVFLPLPSGASPLGFFPGSTIGNFDREEARLFLGRAARTLGLDALLLIGVDTRKERAVLERAYNDPDGVTARFNLNLLARINRELGGDFNLSGFAHRAFYNAPLGRIEMHLESLRDQNVRVARRTFHFTRGETIHTENSYKYAPEEFTHLAATAGWRTLRAWTDPDRLFALYLLRNAAG